MAAAAARVSGELVRERERGSGEAGGGMGCGGARLYSLGVRRASEGDRGDRGIPDPSGSGRSPARSWRGRGVGEDGAGGAGLAWLGWPVGRVGRLAWARRGGEGCGAGWAWGGLAGAPGGFSLFF